MNYRAVSRQFWSGHALRPASNFITFSPAYYLGLVGEESSLDYPLSGTLSQLEKNTGAHSPKCAFSIWGCIRIRSLSFRLAAFRHPLVFLLCCNFLILLSFRPVIVLLFSLYLAASRSSFLVIPLYFYYIVILSLSSYFFSASPSHFSLSSRLLTVL